MMKNSSKFCCLQHKLVFINVAVLAIFLVNTIIFHVYRVGEIKDEMRHKTAGVNGLKETPFRGGGSSYLRVHEKRSHSKRMAGDGVVPNTTKIKTSDRWIIVMLTQFNESVVRFDEGYLSFLDTVHGWTSVIIGETAYSKRHGCKSCLILHSGSQQDEENSTFPHAFRTAIKHGARQIYIMSSLHNVTSALSRMTSPGMQGILYTGKVPFKPCTHFAQPLLSSGRSFPRCHDRNWVYSYTTGELPARKIVGMCEECDQNILEQEAGDKYRSNGSVYCDASTPNVAVNPESFVVSSFGNTLWFYDSFWAMFYYGMAHELQTPASEILRMSFVAQRLLWDLNVSMTFVRSHGLNVTKHDLILDRAEWNHWGRRGAEIYNIESKLCRERELSRSIRILGTYLYAWKCKNGLTIDGCVRELAGSLLESKLISGDEYRVMIDFLSLLDSIPYDYPDRSNGPAVSVGSYIGIKSKTLRFWPSSNHRHWSQNPFHHFCSRFENSKSNLGSKRAKSFAFSSSSQPSSSSSSSPVSSAHAEKANSAKIVNHHNVSKPSRDMKSEIILVVVFKSNDPANHIQMANFYDYMYGRHFRHIVYCTSGTENIDMFAKMYPQPMSVIDLKISDSKLYSYLCMSEVMRMYHSSVRGYLHLDSETLLNPWTILNLHPHLDKPWINSGTIKTRLYQSEAEIPNIRVGQMWRDKTHGRRALNSSIQDLLFISKIIDKHIGANNNSTSNQDIVQYLTKYNKIVKKFISKFNATKLSQFEVRLGVSLVYYVPVAYREQFIVLADEFSRYNVHSYIVIPTIVQNLDSKFLELNGTVLTNRHTTSILSAYRLHDTFLYPWEMYLMPVTKRTRFMCKKYLPQLEASLTHDVGCI